MTLFCERTMKGHAMTIAPGDKLPDFTFKVATAEGPIDRTVAEIFNGRKVVLFAVPGAFTGTCSKVHLPGYLENLDKLKASGVDEVAVVSVNDVFVMKAWAESANALGKITFLADGSALFTKALGLELDLTALGLGVRSKRWSALIEDGVVKTLNIEPKPSEAEMSGAACMIGQLAA
jgi:peroxiredoxin